MIWGIILAAGEGKRMKGVKLNLPLGDKLLIEWVLQAAKNSSLDKSFLVVRPNDNKIIKLGRRWGAEIVLNPDFQSGMSSSIQKALSNISSEKVNGFLILLGDQPLITTAVINQIISNFSPGKEEIVVPFYKGQQGNPVLFDICWYDELLKLSGDVGGKVVVKTHPEKIKKVEILDRAVIEDIDSEEDYLRIKSYFKLFQNKEEEK